jgi:hypothetical protein
MSKLKKRAKAGGGKGRQKKAAPAEGAAAQAPATNAATGQPAAIVSEVPEQAQDAGREVVAVVSQEYGRLRRDAQGAYGRGRVTVVEWEQDLEGYIRRKPLPAVLIGLIVGFLFGRALGGK